MSKAISGQPTRKGHVNHTWYQIVTTNFKTNFNLQMINEVLYAVISGESDNRLA